MPSAPRLPSLIKFLDQLSVGWLLIDEQRRIIHVNKGLCQRIGIEREQLVGVECRYHPGPTGDATSWGARLGPPPECFAGSTACRRLEWPSGSNLARGRLHFMPLVGADGVVEGVVGWLREGEPDPPSDAEGESLHEQFATLRREAGLCEGLDRWLGMSPAARRVVAQARLAAQAVVPVLIHGPIGSGRQHLARGIHRGENSSDGQGTLIPLTCPLIDRELLMSGLRAASQASRVGRTTLLLNDVDQLAPPLQVELRQAWPERGATYRLIATARQTLRGDATFDRELAWRLSTLEIELPRLVERLDDLPLLVQGFIERENAAGSKQIGGCSIEAIERLATHDWPGELDELAEVVRGAHTTCAGPTITSRDLPSLGTRRVERSVGRARRDEPIVLSELLADLERELIVQTLARAKGNKARAARWLGLTRPRLYRRLVQLGLEPARGVTFEEIEPGDGLPS